MMSSRVSLSSRTFADIFDQVKSTTDFVVGTVDPAKLAYFSRYARNQLNRAGTSGRKFRPGSVTFPESHIGGGEEGHKALARILEWIDSNNIASPKALTVEAMRVEEFPEFV